MERSAPPASPEDARPPARDAGLLVVEVEVARAVPGAGRLVELPAGSRVRDAVRAVGLSPEGAAVVVDGEPVPMDEPLTPAERLLVIPTFSGG